MKKVLLFCISLLLMTTTDALGQQVPPNKSPILRAGRYSSLPSGYSQVGSTQLYYKQNSDAIDVIGYYNGYYYSSTYADHGYRLAIQVNGNSAVRVDCLNGTTNNGVTIQPSIEPQGELARMVYTVTNNNELDAIVSLGTHADVMIGNNDHAPISRRVDSFGLTYGLTMKDGNGAQLCVLFGAGLAGVTAVSDFWFGYYYQNNSEYAMVGNYTAGSNYMQENGSYDSGMGWCWKDRTIPAGATVIFSYLIGVGEVNLEPNSSFEVTPDDPEGWNDLSRPHRLWLNGTYESPAGLDGIIDFAVEDSEEWTALTDTLSSGETFNESFVVMFDPTRPVHVIRFRTRDLVGNTTLLPPIEFIDVSFHELSGIQDMTYTGDSIYQTNITCDLEDDTYVITAYRNNVNAGNASFNIEGVFPTTIGRRTYTFVINPQPLVGGIVLDETTFVYNGQAFTPQWQFTNSDYASTLEDGTDYTVTWSDNKLPGTARLTVTGKDNYSGTLTAQFFIDKAPLADNLFSYTLPDQDITYDGESHGATITTATGVGTATITYLRDGETVATTTPPTEPGDYTIYLEIAEGPLYYGCGNHQIGTFSIFQFSDEEWAVLQALQTLLIEMGWAQPWDLSGGIKSVSTLNNITVEEGHVTEIDLKGQGLQGSFPTMLLSLGKLRSLDLSYNNLSGDAATDITSYVMANGITVNELQHLYLNNNQFTGNAGVLAATFANLATLDISTNRFDQVAPMINPSVNLSLSHQQLHIDGNITNGMESMVTSIPTICLYDHPHQTYWSYVTAHLTDAEQIPEWTMNLTFANSEFNMYSPLPYRGANGQVLTGTSTLTGSWPNVQQLTMTFTFAPGDANFNGPVDITDLQTIVNYIFGEYNRMFNFTAANLNNDNTINVQDVVGEANLLLSMDLTMAASGPGRAPMLETAAPKANLYWQDGILYLNTTIPVAAIDIVNEVEGNINWIVGNQGMVVKSNICDQGVHTVIYSLGNAMIQPGVTAIATTTDYSATVVAAKLSDCDAELIQVKLNDELTGLNDVMTDGGLQCRLNGSELLISGDASMQDVNVTICTVDGRIIASKHVGTLSSGHAAISLPELADSHNYYIVVVRNGRQVIATQKLTQIR